MEKARSSIKHIPKKQLLEDVIIESSRENIKIARERAEAQAEHRRQSLLVTQKAQLMDMLKLGIYTIEETKAKIAELDTPVTSKSTSTRTPPTPHTPRTPRGAAVTRFSPAWDIKSGKSLPNEYLSLLHCFLPTHSL
ncbi:hypothetical protein B0H14DRAFT_3507511 [Mycena olivaceomarginata]|nr:hypothetical protein B0H14DRAFT_3507511 [Mycena olivaceomarginata]